MGKKCEEKVKGVSPDEDFDHKAEPQYGPLAGINKGSGWKERALLAG